MSLIDQFQVVLVFLLTGVAMIVVPLGALTFLRPRKPSVAKLMAYECGSDPVGDAQVCFDMRFYTDALIFLVFEVETVFLFPWARVFNDMGAIALFEGLIFVLILFLGLIYVWAKGDIDWVKSTTSSAGTFRKEGLVPQTPRHSRERAPNSVEAPATAGAES